MKQILATIAMWTIAVVVFCLRLTCRFRPHHDPRPQFVADRVGHAIAILHAHQLSAMVGAMKGTGAMVSRSLDGQMIVPALKLSGCVPVRGSGREGRGVRQKGGDTALQALIRHARSGMPTVLAVDGPKGPRGKVQRGIAMLSQKSNSPVVTVILVPSRRWIVRQAWDRIQIPAPFSRIDAYFGEPLHSQDGESVDEFATRIEQELRQMELRHDPQEGELSPQTTTQPMNHAA